MGAFGSDSKSSNKHVQQQGPITTESGSIGIGQVAGKKAKAVLAGATNIEVAKGGVAPGGQLIKAAKGATVTFNTTVENDPAAIAAAAQQAVSNYLGSTLAGQANLGVTSVQPTPVTVSGLSPVTGLPSVAAAPDGDSPPPWVFLAAGAALLAIVFLRR